MATKKVVEKSFEEALSELETLVKRLEQAEVPLADAIAYFQEGMKLSAFCRQTLDDAEKTVTTIIKENGTGDILQPLN